MGIMKERERNERETRGEREGNERGTRGKERGTRGNGMGTEGTKGNERKWPGTIP